MDVMNGRIKKILFVIGILIVFWGWYIMKTIHADEVFYTTYCKDYYAIIANAEGNNYISYDQLIEVNGGPDKITREEVIEDLYMVHVEYADGRLFIFPDFLQENIDTNKIFLEIIELTNPTYRFGKGKIGVGTEKSVIEQVYRSSYQGLQQDVYGQYFVEDGNCLIYFYCEI